MTLHRRTACFAILLGFALWNGTALAQVPSERIAGWVDDSTTLRLSGNTHPLARAEFDRGPVPPETRMDRMILLLEPDAEQRTALEALLAAQQDPQSPEYHRWLTPEDLGARFGASPRDVERVVRWLQSRGFEVEPISGARRQIVFSGTAAAVESAFHTSIHRYDVRGDRHYANASDPEIPAAFASVVGGVLSLHDFHSRPAHINIRPLDNAAPDFTTGGSHYLAPADFSTIYDLAALYTQSINGAGQSIAILGRSDFSASDVQMFRNQFGLPAQSPTVIHNGADPGILGGGEQGEATLDVEWSGAVAPKAAVQFVVSASTNSSDGVALSAQYAVNHNVAPVVSLSFGLCEASLGSGGNQFWNSLWQQAALQGMTVLVSAGDSGAAGCDSASAAHASGGRAVNGLCSSPYSTCVGGTEFTDASNPNRYWLPNNTNSLGSALSYIPEAAWNESGASGLWAGGGGVSTVYAKPAWQAGPGVPADGWRDVPDVSLTSAIHDGYLVLLNGQLYAFAGTSAAAPAFAGMMALAVGRTGARQGNANPSLYTLAARQSAGGAPVFHDVASGNNSVPGVVGYSAAPGYDAATGLGSVDATILVNHWSDANVPPAPACTYSIDATSVNVSSAGGSYSSKITAQSSCSWSAGSNAPWIAVTGSGAGSGKMTGSQTINYVVAANSGAARSGTLTIAGLTLTVNQAQGCTYQVSLGALTTTPQGYSGSVNVRAAAGCSWTAASSAAWLSITSGASGSGNGATAYLAAFNTAKTSRTATLTVAGYVISLTEGAAR